jgi:hypothetical protein
MLSRRLTSRDESGAVAIMFALLAVMLFTVAALGTDIGNEVSRHTDTQTQADFGAFAAARQMTDTGVAGQTPSAAVVSAVADELNANQPQDDSQSCWRTNTCVTTSQLTDGSLANGEVRYTSAGLQVTAPRHWVGFGMARIIGFQGAYVDAQATVNVFSPGQRVIPMFAVNGCDYGLQTLADPSGGGATSVVPPLAFPTEVNKTQLQSPLVLRDPAGNPANTFALNSTGNTVTISAKKWDKSSSIGFFRSDDLTPSAIVTAPIPGAPLGNGTGGASSITITVPAAVTSVETVWWVRIYDGTSANPTSNPPRAGAGSEEWSAESEALPVVVGNAALQCLSGPTVGNFGTLQFPRTDVPTADDLPVNIITGLQPPLTPHVHQWAVDNPAQSLAAGGRCTDGLNGAIFSNDPRPGLRPLTNCVDTDTGLAAQVATLGLIQGDQGFRGLLTNAGTRAGCDPAGGSSSRTINISGGPYLINNDVLTCYFTNGSTSIADIAKASYARVSSAGVLDPSIFDSPRFLWVPVLLKQPEGGSGTYSIVDFRPAFITDEQAISSAIKNSKTGTADNGVMIQGQDVKQLKVVFFNANALPENGTFPLMPFFGTGIKVTRLVD